MMIMFGVLITVTPTKAAATKTISTTPEGLVTTLNKIKNNDADHRYTLEITINDEDDYPWISQGKSNSGEIITQKSPLITALSKEDKLYLDHIVWKLKDGSRYPYSFSKEEYTNIWLTTKGIYLKDTTLYLTGESCRLGSVWNQKAVINIKNIYDSEVNIGESDVTINNVTSHKSCWVNESMQCNGRDSKIVFNDCLFNVGADYVDSSYKYDRNMFYGTATFNRCEFVNGNADLRGGVIKGGGIFNQCKFKNCKSLGYGGVIYTYLNAEQAEAYPIEFNQCSFTNCSAKKGGGVAYVMMNNAITFRGCTFTGNKAGTKGGAIYNCGTVYFKGKASSFLGNRANHGSTFYESNDAWYKFEPGLKKKTKVITSGYKITGKSVIKIKRKKTKKLTCRAILPAKDKIEKLVGVKEKLETRMTYKSSKPSVARITKSGKLIAMKKGTTIIKVYCKGTKALMKEIKVTVK